MFLSSAGQNIRRTMGPAPDILGFRRTFHVWRKIKFLLVGLLVWREFTHSQGIWNFRWTCSASPLDFAYSDIQTLLISASSFPFVVLSCPSRLATWPSLLCRSCSSFCRFRSRSSQASVSDWLSRFNSVCRFFSSSVLRFCFSNVWKYYAWNSTGYGRSYIPSERAISILKPEAKALIKSSQVRSWSLGYEAKLCVHNQGYKRKQSKPLPLKHL